MKVYFLLFLLFIFVFSLQHNILTGKELYTIYYFDRLPYYHFPTSEKNCGSNNSKNIIPEGFLIEITERIFNLANIYHIYICETPKRILEIVKREKNALSVGWFKTKEREIKYSFSSFIYQDQPLVVVINRFKRKLLKEEPSLKEVLLSDLLLGTIDGFSYGEIIDFSILKYNPRKVTFPYICENILKLVANLRCDYTFMSFEEASWLLKRDHYLSSKLAIIKIKDIPFSNKRYLIFNKHVDKNVLFRINKAIKNFRQMEEYNLIIKKYINW